MNLKAIVFDLDGTLADSSGCIVASMHEICRAHNLPLAKDADIRKMIGQPLTIMLTNLFGLSGAFLSVAVEDYSSAYRRLAKSEEHLFDGCVPLLETLRRGGLKLAIATGKSQSGAEAATTRLGIRSYFDSVHGILPGTPGKPDPAVLRRAMKALGVDASQCVMVGDTTFDMDLSAALGVPAVGVEWGVHSLEKLRRSQPSFVASNFDELSRWLIEAKKSGKLFKPQRQH